MKNYGRLVSGIAFVLFAGMSMASSGEDLINRFLTETSTLKGDFTQLLINENAEVLQEASGTFRLLRPGKFRWDYTKPYHQVIVADGKKIWFYDADLEQVSVKQQKEALGNTPALLLTTTRPLQFDFIINKTKDLAGLEWVELRPKDRESNFEVIRIGFSENKLMQMELIDGFRQKTHLQFSDVSSNISLDPDAFVFVPPEGVDVIGDN